MPHPCVVCGRSRMNPNNRAEEYTFFGFPVNDEPRCKKWLEFCCREELYKLNKKQLLQRMICSKHFTSSDFVNNYFDRLSGNAVPSIYDPKQSLYNISCILCNRFRKDPPGPENDDATFHHFPGEEFRCLDWLDFVGIESYYRLTRKEIMFCYICSKHFNRKQFMPGFHNRLIDSAVPDISCPDENVQDAEEEPDATDSMECEVELFNSCEKRDKKIDPLPSVVLESKACAACGRLRSDPMNKSQKYKFHPFPAYEIGRCLKWCQFLEREDILKMSPNQIRKLILCSKHFQAGQNFNNGSGPCDAVPTIKDSDDCEDAAESHEQDQSSNPTKGRRSTSEDEPSEARVSSKKPKMDPKSKPAPLAKKRGKSKRPTTINIPRIETKVDNCVVRKLPIPSANNWRLMTNQFQPIAVTNNIVGNVAGIKKVVLPFSGNITSLGAPIPVNSLSSIPPGLLIKIELPESKAPATGKLAGRKSKRKSSNVVVKENVECAPSLSGYLDYADDSSQTTQNKANELKQEEENEEFEHVDVKDLDVHGNEEVCYAEVKDEGASAKKTKPVKVTRLCKRTLLPIERELRYFLARLEPQIKRLPKRAKAKVKLAIINKVIERL